MNIYQKIYDEWKEEAEQIKVKYISIGIGYSVVVLEDDRVGIAYTFLLEQGCSVVNQDLNIEGAPAIELLQYIQSDNSVMRSIATACVNALNHNKCKEMSNDKNFIKSLVKPDMQVSMVGYFGPVIKMLEKLGVKNLDIIDHGRNVGDTKSFYGKLEKGPDLAIITSTSLLNGTFLEIAECIQEKTQTILMGPSTMMLPEIFKDYKIDYLAGSSVSDLDSVLKFIRLGAGTPILKNYCDKKIACTGR